MRKILIILFFLIFLVSCESGVQPENETEAVAAVNETASTSGCTEQWECVDENYKIFVSEDCTKKEVTKCDRGCVNGTCKAAPVCTVGFKCIDENRRGYQKEDCSYINKQTCEGGCENNKCKTINASQAQTETNSTLVPTSTNSYASENQEENTTVEASPANTIQLGEEQQFEVSGTTHTISIYNLEVDQVIVKVDDLKSDWISEGGSFTYGNIGATVNIEAILFKAYGTKAVDYSIS